MWGLKEGEVLDRLQRNFTIKCAELELMVTRKTGITLKDSGVRDEHGLEPIDGIFSSPEKAVPQRNGVTQYSTIMEDDSMDIGSSGPTR